MDDRDSDTRRPDGLGEARTLVSTDSGAPSDGDSDPQHTAESPRREGTLSGFGKLRPDSQESFDRQYGRRRMLGKGGMGEVLLVRDERIGRDVALKVLGEDLVQVPGTTERFLREARVQGRLEHPSVVPVYELGLSPDSEPYFSMKRIGGQTLAEIIRELAAGDPATTRRFSRRKLLHAISQLCLALDFAHQQGVVHRDLKPANIMFGDFGEVYLLDWGVAKVQGDRETARIYTDKEAIEPGQTRDGAILGTLGYAPPEQLEGSETLDARADVYALGVVLFELLALESLHAPDKADGPVIMDTMDGVSARPSVRSPERDIPPELDTICVRATAVDPAARLSMRELHQALEDFLDGERDGELRARLASDHAAAASAAADRALEGGTAEATTARREALREVGRALALQPEHGPALQTLMRLLTEPPTQQPQEVVEQVDRSDNARAQTAFRAGIFAYAAWALILPLLVWMGVLSWAVIALMAVPVAGAIVVCLLASQQPKALYSYLLVIALTTALGFASRIVGPLILVPMMLAINAQSVAVTHSRKQRLIMVGIFSLGLTIPFALEMLGALPASYAFRDGTMVVLPQATALPHIPTLVMLFIVSQAAVLITALWGGQIRDALVKADSQVALQSWQLRQLMPVADAAAELSSVETPRAAG